MKKALVISILFILPATASAYSLLKPETSESRIIPASHLSLAEEQPLEQPAEQSSPEDQPSTKPLKPVSPGLAFFLASLPISTSLIVLGVSAIPGDGYYIIPVIYGSLSFSFLTIPYHIYVHDPPWKTFTFALVKPLASALFIIGTIGITMEAYDNCHDWNRGDDINCAPPGIWAAFIIGSTAFTGMYLYELIDAPLAAIRYNKKIAQQQGFNIFPYATRDRAGLAFQYSF
ncbi:MAG: hypothetical protein PHE84_05700 [bacterium]|nr:hypothetical protein [bacterium]